jgi:hypothetical protein
VHSLVDFNLHIPSNLLLFLMMGLLATAEMASPKSPEAQGGGQHRKRVRLRRSDARAEPAPA